MMRKILHMKSMLGLILFGLRVGSNSLRWGDYRIGLKRIILPINYWRVNIFRIVADYILDSDLSKKKETKILDIGSPKLLSLYLASHVAGDVYSTDLQDPAIYSEWKKHYDNMENRGNLFFSFMNAKDIPCPEASFDVLYSLSVLHMISPAEDGDILALSEMQRVLKPGGLLIIEIPYRTEYRVNYQCRNNFEEEFTDNPILKERQYDDVAICERIEKNIEGTLEKKIILYEKVPFDAVLNRLPKFASMFVSLAEPYLDMLNIWIAVNEKQKKKGKSVILFFRMKE